MTVLIDKFSGFCHGVLKTIETTEKILAENPGKNIFVIGEIIHNHKEIVRLDNIGLKTIEVVDLENVARDFPDCIIIIRAHGEPPSTYKKIKELNLKLIDATCARVKSLQRFVEKYHSAGYHIIIFGKDQHPEVVGLRGFCENECDVIQYDKQIENLTFKSNNVVLISQTTMNKKQFLATAEILNKKINDINHAGSNINFEVVDSTCKAVTNREDSLIEFAKSVDCLLFVSGKNSSNGKSLYQTALSANPNTYFIEGYEEIDFNIISKMNTIGISGATSTPNWYLEEIKNAIENKYSN
ncbi:MAG: 4-hydroxy-3-methylbut-2-enyl diphosphate reductase [bacterium]